ncbi:MAG: SprA-related family protein [Planctomycetes bacterium]|nr:SprA-related family protein [Planctomycetota bacterium]
MDAVRPVGRRDDQRPDVDRAAEPEVQESRFATEDRVELSGPRFQVELSAEDQVRVAELKERDREVREHESTHLAAAGAYSRGVAQYKYATGPDGQRYAVGGEVQLDTSPIPDDPEGTIAKMQQIRAAALAPGQPSAQDQAVAAQAAAEIQKARAAQTGSATATDELEPTMLESGEARTERAVVGAPSTLSGSVPAADRPFGSAARRTFPADRYPNPQLLDTYA